MGDAGLGEPDAAMGTRRAIRSPLPCYPGDLPIRVRGAHGNDDLLRESFGAIDFDDDDSLRESFWRNRLRRFR